MLSDKEIRGNLFIYCFFQISNICLAVLGFFTFSISIYLMVLTKGLNWFDFLFFVFGIVLIVLSYFGCKLRNAPIGNLIYTVALLIIFMFDFMLTVASFVDRDKTIDYIMSNEFAEESTKDEVKKIIGRNLEIVNDLLLIILLIFVKL
jgi:hypothetical protein